MTVSKVDSEASSTEDYALARMDGNVSCKI